MKKILFTLSLILLLAASCDSQTAGQTQIKKTLPSTSYQQAANSSPSPTEATSKAIANWQTYTDSKEGFSFQYPQDWELTAPAQVKPKNRPKVHELETYPTMFTVSVYDSVAQYLQGRDQYDKGVKTIEDYLTAYSKVDDAYGVNYENVSWNWLNGYMVQFGGMGSYNSVILQKTGKVYSLDMPIMSSTSLEKIKEPFRDMIMSFHFTN